ncbi:MAG: pilin [Candidatus Pacebacteria bacterium]|nr:pilin [Candidatus Paceibacterota bacterium]
MNKYLVQILLMLFISPFCFASNPEGLREVGEIIGNLQDAVLKIGGSFCALMIIVGGVIYSTAKSDPKQMDTGMTTIKYSLLGLIIILMAVVIGKFIVSFGG